MKPKMPGKRNRIASSTLCLLIVAGWLGSPPDLYAAGCKLSFRQNFLGVVNRDNPCYCSAVADFNGDGHLDLAVLLASSGQVLIYDGNGSGGFGAAASSCDEQFSGVGRGG